MPQYGVTERTRGAKYGFTFKWSATFKDEPTPCRCPCCEFGQILLKNVITLVCGAGGPSGRYVDSGVGSEDCTWFYKWIDKERGSGYRRTGPRDRAPPAYAGSRLSGGPHCPGNRGETPPGADTPPGTKPQKPDRGYKGCKYSGKDSPSILVPLGCRFTWEWGARGYIKDICNGNVVRAQDEVEIRMTGSVTAEGFASVPTFKTKRK